MLFKVTHINEQGHRRKARVSARNSQDATDQMERVYGESRAGACMRMAARPVLHVVARLNVSAGESLRGMQCGF